ncbi:hypothetical protein G9394_14720 [Proteus vulgaris]|nr:hypothetical protein G9394_14720 [Proteus vulgaris]
MDWTLGYSFSIILRITLFLLLLTSSLTLVVLDFYFIFEYQEGISDISTLEIVFIVSVIILFKRYIAYTKVTTVSWWTKLTMPLVWYGCFSWLIWIIFSAFILFSGMNQDDYFILDILIIENYIQVLSFFLCYLVCIFLFQAKNIDEISIFVVLKNKYLKTIKGL